MPLPVTSAVQQQAIATSFAHTHTGCKCTGSESSQLLEPLREVFHTQILPRLGLAGVQVLGKACRATRIIVTSLPEGSLHQLAQACSHSLPLVAQESVCGIRQHPVCCRTSTSQ